MLVGSGHCGRPAASPHRRTAAPPHRRAVGVGGTLPRPGSVCQRRVLWASGSFAAPARAAGVEQCRRTGGRRGRCWVSAANGHPRHQGASPHRRCGRCWSGSAAPTCADEYRRTPDEYRRTPDEHRQAPAGTRRTPAGTGRHPTNTGRHRPGRSRAVRSPPNPNALGCEPASQCALVCLHPLRARAVHLSACSMQRQALPGPSSAPPVGCTPRIAVAPPRAFTRPRTPSRQRVRADEHPTLLKLSNEVPSASRGSRLPAGSRRAPR